MISKFARRTSFPILLLWTMFNPDAAFANERRTKVAEEKIARAEAQAADVAAQSTPPPNGPNE